SARDDALTGGRGNGDEGTGGWARAGTLARPDAAERLTGTGDAHAGAGQVVLHALIDEPLAYSPARTVRIPTARAQWVEGCGRGGGRRGGDLAGIWCADPTQQEKTADREALGETHDGALVEGSTRCALRAARRGWCGRGGRGRAARRERRVRTGAECLAANLALVENELLAGPEVPARQARASAGHLLRAMLRTAK